MPTLPLHARAVYSLAVTGCLTASACRKAQEDAHLMNTLTFCSHCILKTLIYTVRTTVFKCHFVLLDRLLGLRRHVFLCSPEAQTFFKFAYILPRQLRKCLGSALYVLLWHTEEWVFLSEWVYFWVSINGKEFSSVIRMPHAQSHIWWLRLSVQYPNFKLSGEISIGRGEACDIHVGRWVLRFHFY